MHPASLDIKFARSSGFYEALKKKVDWYFETTREPRRDHPLMYIKVLFMLLWLFGAYFLLVFVAHNFPEGILYALLLGLGMTGVGFNIQHDANHDAISKFPLINHAMGFSLDLLGISSYIWRWRHNSTHHVFTNLAGVDEDVESDGLGRLAPFQPHFSYHRFQHIYLWFLYALMLFSWQLYQDFEKIIRGGLKTRRFPTKSGGGLLSFAAGKLLFFSFVFGVPMFFHPWWVVLAGYFFVNTIFSASATFILQLAHCAEEIRYASVDHDTKIVPLEWAHHQLNTTVDFAQKNKLLTWFFGGLNFQIEHHFFPKISHIHYPGIAPLVQETCHKFGLPYHNHRTFSAAIASHYRFLKQMGRPVISVA